MSRLQEILIEQGTFRITDNLGAREITFSENFQDPDYERFDVKGETLFLYKGSNYVRLELGTAYNLEGQDWRGGFATIFPLNNQNRKLFKDWFKAPRTDVTILDQRFAEKPKIQRNHEVAVISPNIWENVDNFDPEQNLYLQLKKLFDAGYAQVIHFSSNHAKGMVRLIQNLFENVDCQIAQISHKNGELPNATFKDYHLEHGDTIDFIMAKDTFNRVEKYIRDKNFHFGIGQAVVDLKMRKVAMSISRDQKWQASVDSRRKTFVEKNLGELK